MTGLRPSAARASRPRVGATNVAAAAAVAGSLLGWADIPRDAGARPRRPALAVCFAPGTADSYIADVQARIAGKSRFQAYPLFRWGTTATDGAGLHRGSPTTLTWAIVPDGTTVPGSLGGGSAGSNLRAYLNGIYGSEAKWALHFENVFARWSEVSGVKYVRETADDGATLGSAAGKLGVRADVRIAGRTIDGDYNVLAYNGFPEDGDMVLDTSDVWFQDTSLTSRRLRNVVSHEHGHGLALDHVCPVNQTKLMEPTTSLAYDGPQHDDIRGAQRLYGDAREPNGGTATASDLGTPGAAGVTVENVSIDGSVDGDWYAFTAAEGANADITLRPVGRSYQSGTGGSCTSAAKVDSKARVDLQLSLHAPNGTQLSAADAGAAGEPESLLDVPLSHGAGRYFVRVRGSGEDEVQLYELDVRAVQRGAKPDALDDVVTTREVLPVAADVLANDTGLDDLPVNVRVVTPPAHCRTRVVGGRVVLVPRRGFVGMDLATYEVSDVHRQTSTATVVLTVEPSPRAGDAGADLDGDGYPDEFEAWRGTSPADAASIPGEILAAGPRRLPADATRLTLRRRASPADEVVLRGRLPLPDGFKMKGAVVVLSVAGVGREMTLDGQGRSAPRGKDTLRLRPVRRPGRRPPASARFELRLRRGDFAPAWADEGLDLTRRAVREPRAATVIVLFAGGTYAATLPLVFTADANRSGTASLAR